MSSDKTATAIDEDGMRAAEQWAQWHLGSRDWAHLIIRAYMNPEAALAEVKEAKAKYD